jgi:hypothetical protein
LYPFSELHSWREWAEGRGRGRGKGVQLYICVVLALSRGAGQQEGDLRPRDITILGSNRRDLILKYRADLYLF